MPRMFEAPRPVYQDPVIVEARAVIAIQKTDVLQDMLDHCEHPTHAWLIQLELDHRARRSA